MTRETSETNGGMGGIEIIHEHHFQRLDQALRRCIELDPALSPGCEVLMGNVRRLRDMGELVPGALRNRPAAIEKLRLQILLLGAGSYEIREAMGGIVDAETSSVSVSMGEVCEPRLLNLGGLTALALAAGRVGARLHGADEFVHIIKAMAYATLPAEALSRAQLADGDLCDLLAALSFRDTPYAFLRRISTVLLSHCERSLFDCIRDLLGRVSAQMDVVPDPNGNPDISAEWDGATGEPIAAVERRSECELLIRLKEGAGSADFRTVVFASASLSRAMQGRVKVFKVRNRNRGGLVVRIPRHGPSGLVGLRNEALVERHEAFFHALYDYWDKHNQMLDCLRSNPVPVALFDSAPESFPSFSVAATWGVRIKDVIFVQKHGLPLQEGRETRVMVMLTREVTGEHRVELVLEGYEQPLELVLEETEEGATAQGILPADQVMDPLDGFVRVFVSDPEEPLDAYDFRESLVAAAEEAETGDEAATGAVQGLQRPVLLRPAVIGQNPAGEWVLSRGSWPVGGTHTYATAAAPEPWTLPWLGDGESALEGVWNAAAGAVLPDRESAFTLLEQVAGTTVGLEDQVWVCLLPGADDAGKAVRRSTCARALVVCNAVTLEAALSEAAKLPQEAPASYAAPDCLRVRGDIRNGVVTVHEPARRLQMPAGVRCGSGGEFVTEYIALGLRGDGTTAGAQRLHVARPTRDGAFTLRVPIDGSIESVQLRRRPGLFAVELTAQPRAVQALFTDLGTRAVSVAVEAERIAGYGSGRRALPVIDRLHGVPSVILDPIAPGDRRISWRWGHTRGLVPRVELELGRGLGKGRWVWRRLHLAPGGAVSADIDLERIGPGLEAERLRLLALDGWNSSGPAESDIPYKARPLLIRSAGNGRYWLDGGDRAATDRVEWQLKADGQNVGNPVVMPFDGVLVLSGGHGGNELQAESDGVTDTLVLEQEPTCR